MSERIGHAGLVARGVICVRYGVAKRVGFTQLIVVRIIHGRDDVALRICGTNHVAIIVIFVQGRVTEPVSNDFMVGRYVRRQRNRVAGRVYNQIPSVVDVRRPWASKVFFET